MRGLAVLPHIVPMMEDTSKTVVDTCLWYDNFGWVEDIYIIGTVVYSWSPCIDLMRDGVPSKAELTTWQTG